MALLSNISIHALREEGDLPCSREGRRRRHFYPRPPRGGRHSNFSSREPLTEFLSTPSARRATKYWMQGREPEFNFYPRPPRGGRLLDYKDYKDPEYISIHALREEGDTAKDLGDKASKNFYPRPPRGGRHMPSSA